MQNKFFLILILAVSFGLSNTSAQTSKPKRVSAGIVNGKATSLPKPEYPAAALAVKASGAVNVQVTIDENGNVISASAVSGHPLLRQAAEQAARQATFRPTILSGQPVKVTGVIVYNFLPSKTNEEELKIMGIATFLSVSRFVELDAEWESIIKDLKSEFPQIGGEIETLLKSVNKETTEEKKSEIINKAIASIGNNLRDSDAWQFEIGKNFGELLVHLRPAVNDAAQTLDESAIKLQLLKIRDLIVNTPSNFPKNVLEKFRELDKFADRQDLSSKNTKLQLVDLIEKTLNTISPD